MTIVAISLTATLATSSLDVAPSDDEVAVAHIDVTAVEDKVVVTHEGGDSLTPEELRVDIDGGQQNIQFNAFSAQSAERDEFRAGERWEYSVNLDDEVSVTVVHEPTGTVLARERY